MKQLFLTFAVLGLLHVSQPGQAQVSVQVNIGAQPQWGPVGYDYAEYYYLPDIETYYYVPQRQFIYLSNGRWVFSSYLPPQYSDYNLYSGQKVVVNRPHAYRYFNEDRYRYGGANHYGYERKDRGLRKGWYKKKHRGRN